MKNTPLLHVLTGSIALLVGAIAPFASASTLYLEPVVVEEPRQEPAPQTNYESTAVTGNEAAAGEAVNDARRHGKNGKLIDFLDSRSKGKIPGLLERMAPSGVTSVFNFGVSLSNAQTANTQGHTATLRTAGVGRFDASGLAMQGSGPAYNGPIQFRTGASGAAGPTGRESKEIKDVVPPEDLRWGAWLTGVGEWIDVDGDGNARGFDITTGGFTLGIDYKVSPGLIVGIAAGYAGTGVRLVNDGRVLVNGGKLGVYATAFSGGWYADVAVNGGYNSYDSRRGSIRGAARGSTEGGEVSALFGTGYDFHIGGLTIGPTASFQYSYIGIDGYTERGSLAPLNILSQDVNSLRSQIGFKANYDIHAGSTVIRPELSATWQHEYGDESYDISSSLRNGTGRSFTVRGPELGRDSVLLGGGFAVVCSDRFTTYVHYEVELARDNYERQTVTGGVRISF